LAGSVVDLYVSGRSIPEVSELTGIARSTVRRQLVIAGVVRSRTDAVRLARPKLGSGMRGRTRNFSPEHRANIAQAKREHGERNAKGTTLKQSGYVEFTRGDEKGRSVHVVLMERRIGRRLLSDEVVHHIDGDRANNHPNNLALMTRAAHARLHRREQRIAKGN
jgi:hypothetical protein